MIREITKRYLAPGLGALLLVSMPVSAAMAADGVAMMDKQALDKAIHDYIMANPEVLLESVNRYREREKLAEAESARDAVTDRRAEIFDDPSAPVGGNPGQTDVSSISLGVRPSIG